MYLQSNTGAKIARVQRQNPGASLDFIVRAVWPKTLQPEKKARTVRRYLRGLEREKTAREVGDFEQRKRVAFYGFPRAVRG